MKNLKKKIMIFLAAGVLALSVSPLALAATPQPAGNMPQDNTQQQTQQQGTPVSAAGGIVQQTTLENSKYLTKGSAACWFVVVALVNIALSFWIGNRFYRMSKKDNHMSAEIRALRRDIEDKMVKSIGGFAEQELDIENLNESLAFDEDGIRPADRQPVINDLSEEEEERFRRWEAAQSRQRSEKTASKSSVKSAVREELQEDLDDIKRINRKNYQPKRTQTEEFEDEEDIDATKEIKLGGNVKSKAKEFLSDMFPFKED